MPKAKDNNSGSANSTPANTQVFFGTATSNGTLDLAGFSTTVGGLNVAVGADPTKQAIGNSSTVNNVTLTVSNATAGNSSFSGNIRNTLGTGNKTLALNLQGPNQLTLSGSNSYTGGLTINSGTLQGDTNSILGDVTDLGALTFNQSFDGAFGGSIGGPLARDRAAHSSWRKATHR